MRFRSTTIVLAVFALTAIAAPTAFAKKGGAERENPAPVTSPQPAPVVVTCDDARITGLPNPDTLIVNPLSYDAGCFAVRMDATGTRFTLAAVVLSTGWTYRNESGSDGDKVRIAVSNAASGIKFDALVTSGKTIIG